MASAIGVPLLFALAALAGRWVAMRLVRRITPHADGPDRLALSASAIAALGALCGIGALVHRSSSPQLVLASGLVSLLVVAAVCDACCGVLPDLCTGAVALVAGGVALARGDVTPLVAAACIALPAAALAWWTAGRGFGWGDVKLTVAGGALLGFPCALAAYAGACGGAAVIAMMRGRFGAPAPLGAYLAVAIAVASAGASR